MIASAPAESVFPTVAAVALPVFPATSGAELPDVAETECEWSATAAVVALNVCWCGKRDMRALLPASVFMLPALSVLVVPLTVCECPPAAPLVAETL